MLLFLFQTVLSGDVYSTMSFLVDMMDVSLELLDRPRPAHPSRSLARSGWSAELNRGLMMMMMVKLSLFLSAGLTS